MKKENFKKVTVLLLVMTIFVGFVACGKSETKISESNNSTGIAEEEKVNVDRNEKITVDLNIKIGDYVTFGSYEQDNNTSNGKEVIEWLVLDIKDDKALLISKYGLDAKEYNKEYIDVTWESCTLRSWLNNDFFNEAFSNGEKNAISTTNVIAEDNPEYGTKGGNDTQDKVFLLSISEEKRYFTSDDERKCEPTKYAISKEVNNFKGNCWWWLRSPAMRQSSAAAIEFSGDADNLVSGVVDSFYGAVRPAIWVELG